jgi:hypothetical protein
MPGPALGRVLLSRNCRNYGLKIGTVGALLVRAHKQIRSAARQSNEGETHLAGAIINFCAESQGIPALRWY